MNLDSPTYTIPFLLSLVKLKDDISFLHLIGGVLTILMLSSAWEVTNLPATSHPYKESTRTTSVFSRLNYC